MKGVNGFLWIGTPLLLVLVGVFVWKARHANDVLLPDRVPVTPVAWPTSQPVLLRSGVVYYRYGRPLPVGYKCAGADGLVYRTSQQNGSIVIEPLVRNGYQVRCAGDRTSAHIVYP